MRCDTMRLDSWCG